MPETITQAELTIRVIIPSESGVAEYSQRSDGGIWEKQARNLAKLATGQYLSVDQRIVLDNDVETGVISYVMCEPEDTDVTELCFSEGENTESPWNWHGNGTDLFAAVQALRTKIVA